MKGENEPTNSHIVCSAMKDTLEVILLKRRSIFRFESFDTDLNLAKDLKFPFGKWMNANRSNIASR